MIDALPPRGGGQMMVAIVARLAGEIVDAIGALADFVKFYLLNLGLPSSQSPSVKMKGAGTTLFVRLAVPVRRQILQIRIEFEIKAWMTRGDEIMVYIVDGRGRLTIMHARPRPHMALCANRRAAGQRFGVLKSGRRAGCLGGYHRPGRQIMLIFPFACRPVASFALHAVGKVFRACSACYLHRRGVAAQTTLLDHAKILVIAHFAAISLR